MRGDFASGLGSTDKMAARAFEEILRSIAFAGTEPILESLVPFVREFLEADQAIAYRIAYDDDSMHLDFGHFSGLGATARIREKADSFFSRARGQVTAYHLPTPAPNERNAVYLFSQSEEGKRRHLQAPIISELAVKLGLKGQDQIRVLVCDGPNLLTWIGGFRLEPFGPREVQRLDSLITPLQRRLKLEESLRRLSIRGAALDVAMEALGAPAFILDRRGRVVHSNEAGRRLSSDERSGVLERGRGVLAGTGPSAKDLSLLDIQANGLPSHSLLLMEPGPSSEKRMSAFKRRWALTRRQGEVLEMILGGKANKAIGTALGIQDSTVELHVTNLLRRVGVESRSELVATFWSGGW